MNNTIKEYMLTKLKSKPQTYWELIKGNPFSLSELIPVLNELYLNGEIIVENDVIKLKHQTPPNLFSSTHCPACEGRGLVNSLFLSEIAREFRKLVNSRPLATGEFNQGFILPDYSIYRLQFMHNRGDLKGKKVAFLGDDDLVSLGAALTGVCEEIVALDIDNRILEYLDQTVPKYFQNFSTVLYDVNNKWPEKYLGYFDVIFTDPVETSEGMKLFLSRSVEGLKGKGCSLYFGITHQESPLFKWKYIQESLIKMNLCITDLIRDFNIYELDKEDIINGGYRVVTELKFPVSKPDCDWYTSSLVRAEVVEEPIPLVEGDVSLGKDIYYDEHTYVTVL